MDLGKQLATMQINKGIVNPPPPPSSSDEEIDEFRSANCKISQIVLSVHLRQFSFKRYDIGTSPVYPYQHDVDYKSKLERFMKKKSIEKGYRCDIISLLSTFGDKLIRNNGPGRKNTVVKVNESLRGKCFLLCCVFVPSKDPLYLLSFLSQELFFYNKHFEDDIEIVIVPKTRQGWENDDQAFDLLFSDFTGRLSVPFQDVKRCDFICQCLNFNGSSKALFLDPQQIVLQDNFLHTVYFGAHGFPFTDDRFSYLSRELTETVNSCLPMWHLDQLLLCPTSLPLSRLSLDSQITTTVGQLTNKLVGLYLFTTGDKFARILNDYKLCKKRGIELEIVLIVLPFDPSVHPETFHRVAVNAILNHDMDTNGIWLFPFSNSSCQRLLHLSGYVSVHCHQSDAMITIDPHNNVTDFYGGEVIIPFGIKSYPFTRDALLRRFLKKKQKITLHSFSYGSTDSLFRRNSYEYDGEQVPLAKLQGKNVLLCLDSPTFNSSFFDRVVNMFTQIKKLDSDIELVYLVSMKKVGNYLGTKVYKPEFKWLELTYNPDIFLSLRFHLAFLAGNDLDIPIKGLREGSLLAFGKDGHIHSIDPLSWFEQYGLNGRYPFTHDNCDLRNEVIHEISKYFDFMRSSLLGDHYPQQLHFMGP